MSRVSGPTGDYNQNKVHNQEPAVSRELVFTSEAANTIGPHTVEKSIPTFKVNPKNQYSKESVDADKTKNLSKNYLNVE